MTRRVERERTERGEENRKNESERSSSSESVEEGILVLYCLSLEFKVKRRGCLS